MAVTNQMVAPRYAMPLLVPAQAQNLLETVHVQY